MKELMAFYLGFSSIIMLLAVCLGFKIYEYLKSTVLELINELKKL